MFPPKRKGFEVSLFFFVVVVCLFYLLQMFDPCLLCFGFGHQTRTVTNVLEICLCRQDLGEALLARRLELSLTQPNA